MVRTSESNSVIEYFHPSKIEQGSRRIYQANEIPTIEKADLSMLQVRRRPSSMAEASAGITRFPSRGMAINIRQLQYLVAIIDAGNISAAAKRLRMAQPALGMQIKLLEDELSVSLLFRHSRGVAATPAGKLMYRHALRILDALEIAKHEVQDLRANKPLTLRLGVNPSFVQVLGPELLTDAQKVLPETKVSLSEERTHSLVNALERRQLDLALVYNIEERPDLVREALIEEDLLFLQSKGKQQRNSIKFAQVLDTNLAIGGELSIVRRILESEAKRLSLSVQPAYEVHSLSSMNSVVRRGKATTVMPYALCMTDIKKGTVIGRKISSPSLTRTLYLVQQRTHLPVLDDERVRRFIFVLLRSYCSAIAPYARWISDQGV